MSNYQTLSKINVNKHIEKKGNLSYLSWAWAVDQLLSNDPNATWSYGEPVSFGETLMVFCTVKAFDKEMRAQLPVMDYRNKAIVNPDAMDVNTAMQRCLAKAIALHGIGLYIYAGEDLPEKPKALTEQEAEEAYNNWMAAKEMLVDDDGNEDAEMVANAWGKMPSNVRTGIKKYGEKLRALQELDEQATQHINEIKKEAA